MPDTESVRVAVRVRPFNTREKDRKSKCIVEMTGATTRLFDPNTGKPSVFTFDFSYWSHAGYAAEPDGYLRPESAEYADQQKVYDDLGRPMLESTWAGYNCCLFAYGQTGSGKSYSIVGYEANKGIIPIACREVFERKAEVDRSSGGKTHVHVEVRMLEIYNERYYYDYYDYYD